MSERDCPDEMAVLWAEREERLKRERLGAHPDCRDPAHPGCSQCREYECSCTERLRPECDGVGCAAERANERRCCGDGCNGCDECTDYDDDGLTDGSNPNPPEFDPRA